MNKKIKPRTTYRNGKWIKITSCAKCGCSNTTPPMKFCGELALINNQDQQFIIEDIYKILPNCPKPLWENVRDHREDEEPKDNRHVLIKLTFLPATLDCEIIGWYSSTKWLYREKLCENPSKVKSINMKCFKSWRYIL